MFIVPPGGLRGFANMTPASQRALFPNGNSNSRRRKKKKAAAANRGKRRMKSKGRKIKFGSPAWRKKYKLGKKKK